MKQNISVIIPAYNEEKRIGRSLAHIKDYLQNKCANFEIIVVDDGSKDQTAETARSFGCRVLTNSSNRGKGYSVKRGMLAAQKDIVLFSDADLSTPIEELGKFLPALENHDFLIASRNIKEALRVEDQGWLRKIMGKIFNLIVRFVAGCDVADSQCGFKVFKRSVAKALFSRQTFDGFAFDVEILHIASQLGFSFREIPVCWQNDRQSKVKPFRDSIRMFRDVVRIRMNSLKGLYNIPTIETNKVGV